MKNQSELVAIYLRKSRVDLEAEARGQGETLATHRKTLLQLAEVRGLHVGEIYEEIVSGDTIADRPQMQRLLRDLEQGRWRSVLVMDVDRLGRGDSIDQGTILKTFKYSGTKIITVYKEYDPNNEMDEEFFEFNQQIARSEYRRIKRRLNAGRLASAREGKYQSPKPPFGYERTKLKGQKGYTLTPIPDQADAVRLIFHLFIHGENGERFGMDRIANRINALGFKTFRGKDFARSEIRTILSNPAYIGKIRWNQRKSVKSMYMGQEIVKRPRSSDCFVVDGLHEAIVSQSDWDQAQARLKLNPPHTISDSKLINPFAGLLVCAICGKSIVHTPIYNRAVTGAYRCRTPGCKTSGVDVQYVERAFLQGLQEWLEEITQAPVSVPPQAVEDSAEPQRHQLMNQLKTLKSQQDRLHDFLEQGIYDAETFLNRNRALSERIKAAQSELDMLKKPTVLSRAETLQALKPQIEHVLDAWPHCTSASEKNELARTVVSKIVYSKTHRCYRNETPEKFLTLDLTPVVLSKTEG